VLKYNNKVADFWLKHYLHEGLCSLCGNSGSFVKNGFSNKEGTFFPKRTHFCICPNGQILRKTSLGK